MVVLITGANGRTSRHLIRGLLSAPRCPPLRLLVHSQSSRESLVSAFPQILSQPHSIVVADYLIPDTLTSAFKGISIALHNGPAFHPSEAAMGISVIDAAKESGEFPHVIFCSILHSMRTKLPNHMAKLTIEEYLIESKLNYTILHPTHYMQNVSLASIRETGVLSLGCSPSVSQGFVDIMDMAEIVLSVISSPNMHNFASYELLSQNLPYSSVADVIGREMGRQVECEVLPIKDFVARSGSGARNGEYSQDAVERTALYYDRWGLTGNSNILRWLLGRQPTEWHQYVRRELNKQ